MSWTYLFLERRNINGNMEKYGYNDSKKDRYIYYRERERDKIMQSDFCVHLFITKGTFCEAIATHQQGLSTNAHRLDCFFVPNLCVDTFCFASLFVVLLFDWHFEPFSQLHTCPRCFVGFLCVVVLFFSVSCWGALFCGD